MPRLFSSTRFLRALVYLCSIGYCLLIATNLKAQQLPAIAADEPAWRPVVVVQVPAIQTLTSELESFGQRILGKSQTEVVMLFFKRYGYPDFSGIDKGEPWRAFLFKRGDIQQFVWILAGKAAPDSAVVKHFEESRYYVEKHAGRLWFCQEMPPSDLGSAAMAWMIKAATQPVSHTVEIKWVTDYAHLLADDIKLTLLFALGAPMGGEMPPIQRAVMNGIDLIARRLGNLESFTFDARLHEDALVITHSLRAHTDSPEAALFNLEPSDDTSYASVIPDDYPLRLRTRYPYKKAGQYIGAFLRELESTLEGQTAEWMRQLATFSELYADDYDAVGALALRPQHEAMQELPSRGINNLLGQCDLVSVMHARSGDKALDAYFEDLDGLSGLIEAWIAFTMPGYHVSFERELEPSAFTVKDIPIYRQLTRYKATYLEVKDTATPESLMLENYENPDPEATSPDVEVIEAAQQLYHAIANGSLLTASRPEIMRSLVNRTLEASPKNGLAQAMPVGRDVFVKIELQAGVWFTLTQGEELSTLLDEEAFTQLRELPPITYTLRRVENGLQGECIVPLKTAARLFMVTGELNRQRLLRQKEEIKAP